MRGERERRQARYGKTSPVFLILSVLIEYVVTSLSEVSSFKREIGIT
jgi:hypothetical protein